MATKLASLIGRKLLGKRRRGFARDERGTTAVEFGILGLPFFMIIGAILETSVVFLSGQVLDSAVQDVSRLIRTGQAQSMGIISADKFKEKVCTRLYGLFSDCSALHVEVTVVTNFANATITPPIDWTCRTSCGWTRNEAYSSGQGSSIVVVQVYYKWPVILSLGGLNLGNLPDGRRLLSAATVFRNEPYT